MSIPLSTGVTYHLRSQLSFDTNREVRASIEETKIILKHLVEYLARITIVTRQAYEGLPFQFIM